MDGLQWFQTLLNWMIWGVFPFFLETPHVGKAASHGSYENAILALLAFLWAKKISRRHHGWSTYRALNVVPMINKGLIKSLQNQWFPLIRPYLAITHLAKGPWKKKLNFIFPTKYGIPKSSKG